MIHKKSSKILSLLLCMVMLITSLPISVFGAGFGNMEALGGYITGGSSSGSGYISNLKSMCGYKISVWYAPLDVVNSTEGEKVYMWNSGTEFQVGRTMYITRDKIQDKDTKQAHPFCSI